MTMKACAVATLAALALPAHAQIADKKGSGTAIATGDKDKDPAGYTEIAEPDCWSAFSWCSMPYLNHAVVLFGDGHATKPTFATDSHTFGNSGSGHVRGAAVNGDARFLGASQTITGTHSGNASIITGAIRGNANLINFRDGLIREHSVFEDMYSQDAWRQFANDLWQAKQQGDQRVKQRVRFYFPEEKYAPETPEWDRVVTIKRDSPDYVSANQQVLHVVIGKGRLRADNDQNNKIDGAIIAPDSDVQIHRSWHHLHGFVVARTMREWWSGMPSDTALQIHGQVPTNLYCTTPRPDCPEVEDPVCPDEETEQHYCKMPNIEHAIVAFGNPALANDKAIVVDAHTFGNGGADGFLTGAAGATDFKLGATQGAAVDGFSIFGGTAVGVTPNFNGGVVTGEAGALLFAATYDVNRWTKYVDDLFNSHLRGDNQLAEEKGGQVHFYEVEEGEKVFLNIDKINLDSAETTEVHVVRGEGKVIVPCLNSDGQVAKTWGSIIAPEAKVAVQDCDHGSFIDGFVVAKYVREGWNHPNSGFQIHGRIPKIHCQCKPTARPGCDALDECAQEEMAFSEVEEQ